MQTTRLTRSSVLGKRGHQQEASISALPIVPSCDQLQTPDPTPNPKRARTSVAAVDGDSNKENVPPYSPEFTTVDPSSPRARALRRTSTEFLTPSSRSRIAIRRHASTSTVASLPVTPATEAPRLAISTPPLTPPTSLLPFHARARALLRSTCNNINTEIAARDTERATIHAFLSSFLDESVIKTDDDDDQFTSLYISGTPGTGKTALVNSILETLPAEVKVIFINCMALNSSDALWERLIEELEDGKKRKSTIKNKKFKGREAVETLISNCHTKCILILDELDHVASTTQALASIFTLPNATSLRLIGIANTHTLTSSSSSTSSIIASSNVQTLHFSPYTPTQLLQILQSRLKPLAEAETDKKEQSVADMKKLLPPPTLMLLTKKVAALTGDVRCLFEVLRAAIDLAVVATVSAPPSAVDEESLNTPLPTVTPTHILAALKAYKPSSTSTPQASSSQGLTAASATTNSEIVAKVNSLGLQARLVILCCLLASKRIEAGLAISANASLTTTPTKKSPASPMKRSSLPSPGANVNGVGIDPSQLHSYYSSILNRSDGGALEPVSRSEFGDLIGILEGVGLVCLGAGSEASSGTGAKRAFGRSASFGGSASFITGKGKGKGDVKLAKGVRADEVLRGLRISATADAHPSGDGDVRDEEVRGIWEREKARLARELKNVNKEKNKTAVILEGFDGASED